VITVALNDAVRELDDAATVAGLLAELDLPPRGIAVAVNGEVVRRVDWPQHILTQGDRIDVLTAAQGG
jgi:sulfur carrier protein